MTTAKWLTSLVRARQLQEDAARQRLASAERIKQRANARVRYDEERLASLCEAGSEANAPAFVAAAVALQAAAATHAAAVHMAQDAQHEEDGRRGELGDAARARRSAEELAERSEAAERARLSRAAQRELDEVAARVHRDADTGLSRGSAL